MNEQQTQSEQATSYESFAHRHHHSAESIVTLLEWLLVAFILALVFQGFGVQAFQIPTGSMAETLRGAHYRFRCFRCGYEFDTGKDSYMLDRPQCPNCDFQQPPHAIAPAKNGDRIFVLKCIYQFFDPKRWDVVVFKNPINPRDNYIKRLIALPGETVQLINGDVYINGKIQRKPLNVQAELWMPVFLQDHQPLSASDFFSEQIRKGEDKNNHIWHNPFENEPGAAWDLQSARYTLKDTSDKWHTIAFQPNGRYTFRPTYAYNSHSPGQIYPVCSDLMIRFYVQQNHAAQGCIGASLEKRGILYTVRIDADGMVTFLQTVSSVTTELGTFQAVRSNRTDVFREFEFANVDQQLVLRWGRQRFTYDLSRQLQPLAADEPIPAVKIFAAGTTEIRHIGLYRDIFYLGDEELAQRATADDPFTLEDDQFFVCGDNCNNSSDARQWTEPGIGNNGRTYRMGAVPRDYMMGKAVMVYWSQAYKPLEQLPAWAPEWLKPAENLPPVIPNLGNLKVISGGSEQPY